MALSKAKKLEYISELNELLGSSKMTVVARYRGVTVKSLQQLRKQARENGTKVKVYKNRLVRKALSSIDTFKDTDTSALKEMLLYAFNDNDEVAAAQVLNTFARSEQSLEFVGAFTAEGVFVSAEEVKVLANLPSKPQLLAGIMNTLNAPVRGVVSSLGGNLAGLIKALEARAS